MNHAIVFRSKKSQASAAIGALKELDCEVLDYRPNIETPNLDATGWGEEWFSPLGIEGDEQAELLLKMRGDILKRSDPAGKLEYKVSYHYSDCSRWVLSLQKLPYRGEKWDFILELAEADLRSWQKLAEGVLKQDGSQLYEVWYSDVERNPGEDL